MVNCSPTDAQSQAERLKVKTDLQQLQNQAVTGAGISQWEARVLVDIVDQLFFQNGKNNLLLRSGQMRYSCVKNTEPAGKALDQCQMDTVTLTLFDKEDRCDLNCAGGKASIEMRRRRLARIIDEAYEQGGLLSQEDLSEILMCDARTVRRDIAELNNRAWLFQPRGVMDWRNSAPQGLAVRLWLEGKEPTEVALHIHHSLKATENYLEKFKRVSYLISKGFTVMEMALTIGISVASVTVFKELHEQFKGKALFKLRMDEIAIAGKQFQLAEGEKKSSPLSRKSKTGK